MRVDIANILKRYDGLTVLGNLSVSVQDGEFITVLGPSGSGKTTLLQLLAGLVAPDSGEILFDGQPVMNLAPAERNVAMVFQRYALYPLTVRENLLLPLTARGLPLAEIHERITSIASLLSIGHLLQRHVGKLSGGEQQRVALGRALIRQPSLFLLDEPLSNLDPALRGRIGLELSELHQRLKVTTVMVTHDPSEAMSLGDRVLIIKEGTVEQYGSPSAIYDHPHNKFVAEFTNQGKICFIRGTLTEGTDSVRFACEGLSLDLPTSLMRLPKARSSNVVLGLRPDSLVESENGILAGSVTYTQMIAGEFYSFVRTPLGQVIARTLHNRRLQISDQVRFSILPDAVLLFDPETEENLVPCQQR